MKRVISETKLPVKLWLDDIEPEAEAQVKNLANLPFIHKHVAVMPDAHAGRGSTIGTVIATKGAIIPAAVGVDIGCGMCAVKLPFMVEQLGGDEKLRALRHSIERSIPVGFRQNSKISSNADKVFASLGKPEAGDFQNDLALSKALHQLGSLGGGNHFIEICTDTEGGAWVMLHSGSRNIGKRLADIHISSAKNVMLRYFIDLPDPDLAFFSARDG